MPNCEPPVEHQFKPGQSGNPGGKTSEQKKRELANAEKATLIREKLLKNLHKALEDDTGVGKIENAVLKLLKDSEDRGLGQPTQPVEFVPKDALSELLDDVAGKGKRVSGKPTIDD